MKEYAQTMKEPGSSNALAHRNILVINVKLIDVIFTNAKITELVLLLLSTTFQHRNVNAWAIMEEQLVMLTCVWTLNVGTELVLKEIVSVMKVTSMRVRLALTFVMVSIVEPAVFVRKEFVIVMKVMPTLEILV